LIALPDPISDKHLSNHLAALLSAKIMYLYYL